MIQQLTSILGDYVTTGSDEFRFCCTFCGNNGRGTDTNYHLYVNRRSGLYFCQRCESNGHVSYLLKSSTDLLVYDENKKTKVEALLELFSPKAEERAEEIKTADLPDDYVPIHDYPHSEAARYLESRGIPLELAIKRGIGFGMGLNKGRVIFPMFNDSRSKCIYWVARSYANQDHYDGCKCFLCKIRYKNAPDTKRRYFIYGIEFCRGDECCVTEGAISALNAGPNSVGTLGKYVTDEQLEILADRFDKIQVALDPDAKLKAYHLAKKLMMRRKHVEFIPLPSNKDPADLGVNKMMELRNCGMPVTRASLATIFL